MVKLSVNTRGAKLSPAWFIRLVFVEFSSHFILLYMGT